MKKIMNWRILLAGVLLLILGYRLNLPPAGAKLTIAERTFDFGEISDSVKVAHVFILTNTGDDLLTINDVSASCGCTVAELDKKQLAPGDSSKLHVTFNPENKGIGPIQKMIWISSTSHENSYDSLTISATIAEIHPEKMGMTIKGIFEGDCGRCHVTKGVGKLGMELFKADCLMCHNVTKRSTGPRMDSLFVNKLADTTLQRLLTYGIPRTNMPAFAKAHGGPLSEEQINSLVQLLAKVP